MESKLLSKYGGRNLNKKLLLELINDIKNYKEDKKVEKPNLTNDNVMKVIDGLTNKDDKKLSQKSIEIYKRRVKNLNLIKVLEDLIKFKNNKNEVNKILKDIEMQKSKKLKKDFSKHRSLEDFVLLNQMINNIDHVFENLNEYVLNRINQHIQELVKLRTDAKDEKVSFDELKIEWTEYLNKVKELTDNPNVPLKIKILFNLYKTYQLRDDYGNVLLTDKDLGDDINFYNVKTREFFLNQYKGTAKAKYGKKIYKIPQYIADMIMKRYDDGNKYLIGKNKNETYNGNGHLTSLIKDATNKYFGKQFSINDIRRSVVSYYHEHKSIPKRKQLAEIMLHSYQEAVKSYNREEFDKDE
jgi:hypothetical protein